MECRIVGQLSSTFCTRASNITTSFATARTGIVPFTGGIWPCTTRRRRYRGFLCLWGTRLIVIGLIMGHFRPTNRTRASRCATAAGTAVRADIVRHLGGSRSTCRIHCFGRCDGEGVLRTNGGTRLHLSRRGLLRRLLCSGGCFGLITAARDEQQATGYQEKSSQFHV